MIIIMECTDCKHCASYEAGETVACLHPGLPANQVQLFYPDNLTSDAEDAIRCPGFQEGLPKEFMYGDLQNARREFDEGTDSTDEGYFEALREYALRKLGRT